MAAESATKPYVPSQAQQPDTGLLGSKWQAQIQEDPLLAMGLDMGWGTFAKHMS